MGLKTYAIEDHLIDQMIQKRYMDYLRDFFEQADQSRVWEDNRTRGLRRSKAFQLHLEWEFDLNNIMIQANEEILKNI